MRHIDRLTLDTSEPVPDARFFVAQQYADLLGREPDQPTLDKLAGQLIQCGNRSDCLRARKLDVFTDLLVENELSSTVVVMYGVYSVALGRQPRFSEFESDRSSGIALATSLVERPEFKRRFPATMKPVEFVDSVLASLIQSTGVDLSGERTALLNLFEGPNGRAAVLAQVASDQRVIDANYNHALVLYQYFAYLRRNPDEAGYNTWVNTLKRKPLRDPEAMRSLVCNFLNSAEYQTRFGMVATHQSRECI